MPVAADADGSEDVNDFLQRIKELGDQRDREDEERTRKLEEEILQGRRERQARRAERARSLSPTKDASTHAGTPGTAWSHNDSSMLDELSRSPSLPQPHSTQYATMDATPRKPPAPELSTQASPVLHAEFSRQTSDLEKTPAASSSATKPQLRSNPLSWQQRPSSRGSVTGSVRSQPSPAFASDSMASRSPRSTANVAAPETEESFTRSQIAQSLGSKEPSFFKQTQDRGLASAAYRKTQVEEISDSAPTGKSMKLPGMQSSSHPTDTMSQESSVPMSSKTPFPSASSNQRFEPPRSAEKTTLPTDDVPSDLRAMAMSPSQGRLSPERRERPSSPTKGLGGFVQSAMMKRSDSVNKRWSAQGGSGLSRGNSVTSAIGLQDGGRAPTSGVTILTNSRQSSIRETVPSASSRPSSSQNHATVSQPPANDQSNSGDLLGRDKKTELPETAPAQSFGAIKATVTPSEDISGMSGEPLTSPPTSPSKRWSPTKSSWLGNALSKPESPKIISPAASQQPAWMADLNRNKQQREIKDAGSAPSPNKAPIEGLVRSPPPDTGYKPPSLGGSYEVSKSKLAAKPRTNSFTSKQQPESGRFARHTDELSKSSTLPNMSKTEDESFRSPSANLKSSLSNPLPKDVTTKPETPPKKDFRSNLKPQQMSNESKGKDEPEFRNVFGKLKKTQTQNYVAPDELKENIMRGKTGLAKTGGPQRSIVKDEFKESILKKKEGMNVPTASTKITSASAKVPDTSTPEAIAKRRGMGMSEGNVAIERNASSAGLDRRKPEPKPEALSKLQSLRENSRPVADNTIATKQRAPESSKSGLGVGFASSLAGILQKGPPPLGTPVNPSQATKDSNNGTSSSSARDDPSSTNSKGPELTHATKGRAKGPKRKPPTAVSRETVGTADFGERKPQSSQLSVENQPFTSTYASPDVPKSKPLSVTTDNRNNIRKFSQPNTPTGQGLISKSPPLIRAQASVAGSHQLSSPKTTQGPGLISPGTPKQQGPNIPKSQDTIPLNQDLKRTNDFSDWSSNGPLKLDRQEQEPPKGFPLMKNTAASFSQSPTSSQQARSRSPLKLSSEVDEDAAMTGAGLRSKGVIGLGIETNPYAKDVSQEKIASPSIKNHRSPPNPDQKPASLRPQKSDKTAVVNSTPRSGDFKETTTERVPQVIQLSPTSKSPKSPPLPGRKPSTMDSKISTAPAFSPDTPKRIGSPSKKPSKTTELFSEILDEYSSKVKLNVDTQAILDKSSANNPDKIKTLRKQIFEITENGKSVPIPSDQEHILFEDSLYLCTHVFGTSTGARKTEVYLWCGDGVSPSAVEDAQLFARKTAKDNSGKLVVLQQGREPSIFFQALGGIVITRRGSSDRSDSATYMLCGRRHLGQIAFDEVDFDPKSLCIGFPYIISARGGRLFLWKGTGASADELGCARLIGMDLGLTGEIEEVSVGEEPAEFWSSFPTNDPKSATTPGPTSFWHLKPAHDRYANKLFEIDVESARPKSSSGFMSWGRRGSAPSNDTTGPMEARVQEISPFSQANLAEDGVFVLDAFFEVFIIFRLRTNTHPAPQHRSNKSSCLRAALLFAQDYGILAASVEDRPFVPQSCVVILSKPDGNPSATAIPEGMRTCFRKWGGDGVGQEDVTILTMEEVLMAEES